jgi:hypothetical protein
MKKFLVTLSAILVFACTAWAQEGSAPAPSKHAKHHHGKHHKAHSHKSS